MAEDYRPHLLITEDDVKPFENKRQARTKDFGMDPAQHGSKLSGDLQAIVDAYTKAQGVDSLSGEGVRLFEIVLREGENRGNHSRQSIPHLGDKAQQTRKIPGEVCI